MSVRRLADEKDHKAEAAMAKDEAIRKVKSIALQVLADMIESGETDRQVQTGSSFPFTLA